jgi:glycosyltransferase involved in cell wall biosynthesis
MHIVFADNTLVYNGRTPDLHPLGGSQASLIYATRCLAEQGHRVVVYNHTLGEPQSYDGVEYRHITKLQSDSKTITDVDVFVSNRDPRLVVHWKGSGKRVVRMQDDWDQPMCQAFLLPRCRRSTDHVIAVSDWQRDRFRKVSSWPKSRISVVPNGFWEPFHTLDRFPEKVGNRLVYCSTPFRGLARLVPLFPMIKEKVPDVELHVYSDMKVYQYHEDDDQDQYGEIYKSLDVPGIVHHGSIGQADLIKELEKTKIFAYTNIFAETSCIAQMEAQAAGNLVVTTGLGALPETIGPHGVIIPGFPGEEEYNRLYVEKIVKLLTDEEGYYDKAEEAREWIFANNSYQGIVGQQWSDELERIISDKGRKTRCLI